MKLFAPHRGEIQNPTRDLIATVISELPAAPEGSQFAILESSEQTYIQTLFTQEGFVLQYQDGNTEHHFESVRGNLTAGEVIEAFGAYLDRNPAWRFPFEWQQVEVRPLFYRMGHALGHLLGRIFR